jgi:drug/metabolite transporter (DMT)-like permease
MSDGHPIRTGVTLAGLAALLFGLTAPIIARASTGAGALCSASLLYLGAALAAAVGRAARWKERREAPIRGRQFTALLVVAASGGLIAPVLLVLGLRTTDAASAALLLALEAPFTLLLARVFYREHLGARVLLASALIGSGALLAIGVRVGAPSSVLGGLFICGATLAWALDNVVSRWLADRDPVAIVAGKGLIGGGLAAAAAFATGQVWPVPSAAVVLLASGAGGYGVSLQLYLHAQRIMGAARTASVFAAGPFVGAFASLALGTPWPGWHFALSFVLIALGVWMHATERHAHLHQHEELEHEHLHSHDDGHHDHRHDPMPAQPHSHTHRHSGAQHSHAHSEDIHHRHKH